MGLISRNLVSKEEQDITSMPDPSQGIDNLLKKYQALKLISDSDGSRDYSSEGLDGSGAGAQAYPDFSSLSGGLIGNAMSPLQAGDDAEQAPAGMEAFKPIQADQTMPPMAQEAEDGSAQQQQQQPAASAGPDAATAGDAYSADEAAADTARENGRFAAQDADPLAREYADAMAVLNKAGPQSRSDGRIMRDFDPDNQWDGDAGGLGDLRDGDQLAAKEKGEAQSRAASKAPPSPEAQQQAAERAAKRLAEDREALKNPRVMAFLDTVAATEGGDYHGTHEMTINNKKVVPRFTDESKHPGFAADGRSVAGRYQMRLQTWKEHGAKVGLTDFAPSTQDVLAIEELRSAGVLDAVKNGNLDAALPKAAGKWSSLPQGKGLPGHYKDQKAKTYETVSSIYKQKLRDNGVNPQQK